MSEAITTMTAATEELEKVEKLATILGGTEHVLESGYAQLACAILNVQKNRYWEGRFESWGKYIEHISTKFNLGRAQLYHKVSVVKELQGVVEPKDLSEMGISKAGVLADAHKTIPALPSSVLDAARDKEVTAKELKKVLAEATHVPESSKDEWYDMGAAFYVTPDEKSELLEAERAARSIDPTISISLKPHAQMKEVMLRWAREFLSTYSASKDEIPF